jgi:hypothetical protein
MHADIETLANCFNRPMAQTSFLGWVHRYREEYSSRSFPPRWWHRLPVAGQVTTVTEQAA